MSARYDLKYGDRVKFSGEGAVVDTHAHAATIKVMDNSGAVHFIYPSGTATIEKGNPANWPPQVGDIWDVGGTEYFARAHSYSKDRVVLVSASGGSVFHDNEYEGYVLPKSPALIRRRTV